jgi:hypothetical protein
MPWRDIRYVSFVNLSEGRILDFMTERIRQEARGEGHNGLPQQRRDDHRVSRKEQALPHQWT